MDGKREVCSTQNVILIILGPFYDSILRNLKAF